MHVCVHMSFHVEAFINAQKLVVEKKNELS